MPQEMDEARSPFRRAVEAGIVGAPGTTGVQAGTGAPSGTEQASGGAQLSGADRADSSARGATTDHGSGGAQGRPGLAMSSAETRTTRMGCPVEHERGRWIDPFFDALASGASVSAAACAAGVHETWVYMKRRRDPAFRKRWNEVRDINTRLLEQEAQRRAYHGVDRPVYHKGMLVGYERRYSDTLLIFMLKARKPEVYRDGYDETARGNVQININVETTDRPAALEVVPPVPLIAVADTIEEVVGGDRTGGSQPNGAGVPEAAPIPGE